MRPSSVMCAIAAAFSASAHAAEVNPKPAEELVIVDGVRTAFYERAPISLAGAMSRAVGSWCLTADRNRVADTSKSSGSTVGWLCGRHKLRYFRSVYVTGARGSHGLVCEDNGTSSLKYFGLDLVASVIEDGSCVPAVFDGTEYQLSLENVNARR